MNGGKALAYSLATAVLAFLPRIKFAVARAVIINQYLAKILAGFGLDEAGTATFKIEVVGSGWLCFGFFTIGATHADFN
jgi:hypothetical protein